MDPANEFVIREHVTNKCELRTRRLATAEIPVKNSQQAWNKILPKLGTSKFIGKSKVQLIKLIIL